MWKYDSYMDEIGSERSEIIGKNMKSQEKIEPIEKGMENG